MNSYIYYIVRITRIMRTYFLIEVRIYFLFLLSSSLLSFVVWCEFFEIGLMILLRACRNLIAGGCGCEDIVL